MFRISLKAIVLFLGVSFSAALFAREPVPMELTRASDSGKAVQTWNRKSSKEANACLDKAAAKALKFASKKGYRNCTEEKDSANIGPDGWIEFIFDCDNHMEPTLEMKSNFPAGCQLGSVSEITDND